MKKITLSQSIFDSLYSVYDLRSRCGEYQNNVFGAEWFPDGIQGVNKGDKISILAYGKQTARRSLNANVLSTDPITIEVIRRDT